MLNLKPLTVKARAQFQASQGGFVKGKIGARRDLVSDSVSPVSFVPTSPRYMILAVGRASLYRS